ncbi:MAG TPA: PadR family transcriptional regulator [Candidatus Scatomorpha merdigallinarum]|nr:PadR family transcriptional regulator [Candidatus Scatomorpha merdigallinarum]
MRDSVSGGALTEVTFYILLALCEPRHGYAVMQFVSERTGGRLELGAGTLYGALGTLEKRGWIKSCGGGGRRREYVITPEGLAATHGELARLRELTSHAEEILKEVGADGTVQVFRTDADGAGEMAQPDVAPGLAAG